MNNNLYIYLIIFINLSGFSQISFQKGYLIKDNEEKVECYIKNIDWRNSPNEIEYKFSQEGEIFIAKIDVLNEFGVYNNSKYIRSIVKIDESKDNLNEISYKREPLYNEKRVFLKVLIEGKASLYLYESNSLINFFLRMENGKIEPLIYKTYQIEGKLFENKMFMQQLRNSLKCTKIEEQNIKKIRYKKKELIDLFKEYNTCSQSNFVSYEQKVRRDLFNINIRPRLNNSKLTIENSFDDLKIDLENKINFGIGVEAELIMPYNKNKWGFLIEPTFKKIKENIIKETDIVYEKKMILNLDYTSIELPFGIRHYFFLNNNSKLFLNVSYIFDLNLNSKLEVNRIDDSNLYYLEFASRNNFGFGFGYKFKNTYSLEVRTHTNRVVLSDHINWKSKYQSLSIIFGYSFF